jgi:hypothetical protein
MVILTGLKILYSFLYRKYINRIHFNFFFHPPSPVSDVPLAWPVFHNIAACVLGLYSTYERKHVALVQPPSYTVFLQAVVSSYENGRRPIML